MPPTGLAILIGAGPTTGAGIARILASPAHGNLAVALLSRTADPSLTNFISKSCYGGPGVLQEFKSDTSESNLTRAFDEIRKWSASLETGAQQKDGGAGGLKLKMAVYNVKHSHKVAFEEETAARYTESLTTYATGAMVFSQLALKWMLGQYSGVDEEKVMQKKGTIIFTATLGALRTNPQFAAYGATRASVRMLAQSLAREFTQRGVHVVHAIANGGITDQFYKFEEGSGGEVERKEGGQDMEKVLKGEKMKAESVGKLYLGLADQECDLWVHELDMRPAAEKF